MIAGLVWSLYPLVALFEGIPLTRAKLRGCRLLQLYLRQGLGYFDEDFFVCCRHSSLSLVGFIDDLGPFGFVCPGLWKISSELALHYRTVDGTDNRFAGGSGDVR